MPAGLARVEGSAPGKSCILLRLVGGPSQLDTWDLKPDAPSGVRGAFRPIRTNVPGMEISEIFPKMARQADKYALIRSMHYEGEPTHEVGDELIQTGRLAGAGKAAFPTVGSVVADFTGTNHVVLPNGPDDFAANCMQASRLVASGVRFVTVNMFETVFDETTWDSHGWKPFSSTNCYRDVVGPMFDEAYSALLVDLDRRGLLATTLVVATGEFGRTPKINPTGGRDHWPGCWTAVVAGGGVVGGQVYGSSDCLGAEPRENPVTPGMLAATIYSALGVPLDRAGVEPGVEPVHELFRG